jgi:hypothetical protein
MTAGRQPPAATSDLDRARALLANDPDEMDEQWLAEIIAAVRAEAVAAERERIARRVSEQQILRFQVGRDPLVEVNEIVQDLAHDIATDWAFLRDEPAP